MFVAITIQPSMLRTATAFSTVLASVLVTVVAAEGFLSVSAVLGDGGVVSSAVGGFVSTSISVDMVGVVVEVGAGNSACVRERWGGGV